MRPRRRLEEAPAPAPAPKAAVVPVVKSDEPLHVKYRPQTLDEVLGQDQVVASLKTLLTKTTRPHSFLFTGPSGCGKTTLARILGREFDCSSSGIIETDAATHTGIDDMRAITETLRFQGFGATPNKLIIIDECHALSKNAWQALLKAVEEPPAHVFFAFCTTEPGKVPETVRTRCASYNLDSVKLDVLRDLLEFVCESEGFKTADPIIQLVARSCNGSPRQALVMLAMVHDLEDRDEAAIVLQQPLENPQVINLCRALASGRGGSWPEVKALVGAMDDQNPESIRIVVMNYMYKALLGAKSSRDEQRILAVMQAFERPFNPSDKLAPVLLALATVLMD